LAQAPDPVIFAVVVNAEKPTVAYSSRDVVLHFSCSAASNRCAFCTLAFVSIALG